MASRPRHPGAPGSRSWAGGVAQRVAVLLASVMDLHVQMALQEVSQERRRVITGLLLLVTGAAMLTAAMLLGNAALLFWLAVRLGWGWIAAPLAVGALDLLLAGLLLRAGGAVLKGPYLAKTVAGISKTTQALMGR